MNTTKQKPEKTVVTGTEKNPAKVAQAPATSQTRTVVFTEAEKLQIRREANIGRLGPFLKGLKLH
jgi:hypothetical protein